MWHKFISTAALAMLALTGCQTLRAGEGEEAVVVAAWPGVSIVDKDGRKVPAPAELIARALNDVGIRATVDESGLHVPPGDETRAQQALLTDKRLVDSGILVFVPVAAGTGTKTARGIEFILEIDPPTTAPTK